jgi:aminoglycoside N3'-acetyltransferase
VRTSADLVADLRRLGVRPGDLLMVHASLRRLGPVQGRAAGVVAALDAAVGPGGSWLMNLGAIEQDPDVGRPFDPLVTPADPDVGVLAEVMRTTPGTEVSDHPDARFGARGPDARAVLDPVPWDDYYGPGSALDRLVRHGGKVLRLGADPDTVTLIHLAEYLVDLPGKRRVSRQHLVRGRLGPTVATVTCLDDSDGIVAWPGEDYFALITKDYLAGGGGRAGPVGDAVAELIDAADLVGHAVAWMADRFGR